MCVCVLWLINICQLSTHSSIYHSIYRTLYTIYLSVCMYINPSYLYQSPLVNVERCVKYKGRDEREVGTLIVNEHHIKGCHVYTSALRVEFK